MIYADTSFFVSVYIGDRHWPIADKLLHSDPRVWFTPLHLAEWTHAVWQHVFRGQMSADKANAVRHVLETDQHAGFWVPASVPESAFQLCSELGRRHGSKLGIRTLDSLHVACALEFKAERFWTFDERQVKLAKVEGLRTL